MDDLEKSQEQRITELEEQIKIIRSVLIDVLGVKGFISLSDWNEIKGMRFVVDLANRGDN